VQSRLSAAVAAAELLSSVRREIGIGSSHRCIVLPEVFGGCPGKSTCCARAGPSQRSRQAFEGSFGAPLNSYSTERSEDGVALFAENGVFDGSICQVSWDADPRIGSTRRLRRKSLRLDGNRSASCPLPRVRNVLRFLAKR